jgi:hypothetical protein
MSREPSKTSHNLTLALAGLGVGVISVAFTLKPPPHTAPAIFWSVLALGIGSLLVGGTIVILGRTRAKRAKRIGGERQRLVAAACDRYADALSAFLTEQWRQRPRQLPFGNGVARLQRWQEEVEARYRKNFQPWGLETFDEAANFGGVASSLRASVEAPDIEQLKQQPGLFRDAARSLERGLRAGE